LKDDADADARVHTMDGFGAVGWGVDAATMGGTGTGIRAGRRRRMTSLALGPAAGTRSSSSRWRMRSALIWGAACRKGCGGCRWAGEARWRGWGARDWKAKNEGVSRRADSVCGFLGQMSCRRSC
jgi:hypothetical protein